MASDDIADSFASTSLFGEMQRPNQESNKSLLVIMVAIWANTISIYIK